MINKMLSIIENSPSLTERDIGLSEGRNKMSSKLLLSRVMDRLSEVRVL